MTDHEPFHTSQVRFEASGFRDAQSRLAERLVAQRPRRPQGDAAWQSPAAQHPGQRKGCVGGSVTYRPCCGQHTLTRTLVHMHYHASYIHTQPHAQSDHTCTLTASCTYTLTYPHAHSHSHMHHTCTLPHPRAHALTHIIHAHAPLYTCTHTLAYIMHTHRYILVRMHYHIHSHTPLCT